MRHFVGLLAIFTCILINASAFDLTMNPQQEMMVNDVITFVGREDEATLMEQAGELMPKVMMILQESPIKVISYVCNHEDLKYAMLEAAESPFKWNLFEGGFTIQMNQEMAREDFSQRVDALCENLSVDRNDVNSYIENLHWGDFALYLLRI